jgi:hypothetical protein
MNYAVEMTVVLEVEAADTDHAIRLVSERLKSDGYEHIDFKACYSRKAPAPSEGESLER